MTENIVTFPKRSNGSRASIFDKREVLKYYKLLYEVNLTKLLIKVQFLCRETN